MTREQIEDDIFHLQDVCTQNADELHAIGRAIARLRADLAKLDGPAEGFVRVRVDVAVEAHTGRWSDCGSSAYDRPTADTTINGIQVCAIVTADVQIPRHSISEIAGEVSDV